VDYQTKGMASLQSASFIFPTRLFPCVFMLGSAWREPPPHTFYGEELLEKVSNMRGRWNLSPARLPHFLQKHLSELDRSDSTEIPTKIWHNFWVLGSVLLTQDLGPAKALFWGTQQDTFTASKEHSLFNTRTPRKPLCTCR